MLRRRVAKDLGDLRVGDITRHDHLDPWKAALAQELRPASVRKHWTVLDREQAGLLLACCREPIRPLVLAALGTGMRLGELLGLRAGDVRLDEPTAVVRVEQALTRTGEFGPVKTPRSRRSVLLPPQTAAVFAGSVAGKQPGELVFPAPGGGPWDAGNLRYRYWRPAVVAA